ncbi:MAG TPA: arsenic resistance N-acetyltransferase ArsN2 [Burkholderiaceae bacterium]|nr:arsenic resistance N-acetyltransferase ArsN2 [Burkholderiaceae bacterium]
MMAVPVLDFRRADIGDLPAVLAFLLANARPVEGVAEHLEQFWIAASGEKIVGCAGRETYGEVALLRSVAVLPERRNQGIGKTLIEHVIHDAASERVKTLYLLTASAGRYFEGLGFRAVDKAHAPKQLLVSAEFQGACPPDDILMALPLALRDEAALFNVKPGT